MHYMRSNILFLFLSLVFTGVFFSSCKKGDNDPFLSTRSRKARMVGSWKLHSGSTFYSYPFQGDVKETYTNSQIMYDSAGVKKVNAFTWDITFENEGSFTSVIQETAPGGIMETETIKGRWQFVMNNKKDDLKNREAIILTVKDYSISSGGVLSGYKTINPISGSIWRLDQLSHHEFTIVMEETEAVPAGIRKDQRKFTFRSLKKSVVV